MNTKHFSLLFFAALAFATKTLPAKEQVMDGVKWFYGTDPVEVFGASPVSGTLVIPWSFSEGGNVVGISSSAFSGCSGLTSVKIHDGVKSIGNCAFSGCPALTSVTIQSSVWSESLSIGTKAFSNCPNLGAFTIPSRTTLVVNDEFNGCSKVTSIRIPDDVTSIGNYAFSGCSKLTSLSLPGRFRGNTSGMGIPSGCTVTFRD